ncbi:MAG: hypothetical protein WEA29_08420 [Acidimicrobiia bacterium]
MSPVSHDHTPSLRRLHGLVWFAWVFRPIIDWAAIRRPFRRLMTANGIALAVSALDFSVSRTLLRDGSWEPITSDLMRTRLSEGDTAVDIGARLGYHTLLMSRAVGPTGRVVAFEPDRRLASLLTHNVAVTVLTTSRWSKRLPPTATAWYSCAPTSPFPRHPPPRFASTTSSERAPPSTSSRSTSMVARRKP